MPNLQQAQQHVQSVIRRLEAIEENTDTKTNSTASILEALMEMYRYEDIPRMVEELKQVDLYLESKMTPVAAEVKSTTY
ncbi:hypothetical protein [Paenibacillus polymyxa]|uniref:hypothetical protein n=1 Tax=Paenibacillus polymyxa TaxID=1406 RepID=UPI00129B1CF3|nr:hypothetical protein [Paenibacillus polymyxa]KAE8559891.1 hypothetical protein BJH92_11950 [Paenibacillus polymyxa]MCJ1221264.1 hypothetical protein [Paenibacillus polymyxa]